MVLERHIEFIFKIRKSTSFNLLLENLSLLIKIFPDWEYIKVNSKLRKEFT